jgi:hypothetical protein
MQFLLQRTTVCNRQQANTFVNKRNGTDVASVELNSPGSWLSGSAWFFG